MENANPPPTNNRPVLPTAMRAKVVQELNELHAISAYIDFRLENIDQFLNGFTKPPNEIDMDDLEPDDESVDTPLVSLFLDSDDDSDDDEVLNCHTPTKAETRECNIMINHNTRYKIEKTTLHKLQVL
ncbi:hypothetical protein Tco_0814258 [Tanacetum coccineum]